MSRTKGSASRLNNFGSRGGLTPEQRDKLFMLHDRYGVSLTNLGIRFGISRGAATCIVRERRMRKAVRFAMPPAAEEKRSA